MSARVKTPAAVLIDAPWVALAEGEGAMNQSASTCAACHQRHYQDWSTSTHASALTDLQFLAEISKDEAPRWLCLNCHIPLQQQRPYLIEAGTRLKNDRWDVGGLLREKNPKFAAELVKEGITCATCHVRRDVDGRGVIIGPRGAKGAPHRTRKDPAHLENICQRCHDPGPVEITPQFFCWFETRREIPSTDKSRCIDCHMPEVNAVPAIGQPARPMRAHWWRGGGPAKTLGAPLGDVGVAVKSARSGDVVTVTLAHRGAGHWVPSGDPERHLLVEVNEQQRELGQRWDFGDRAKQRPAKKLEDTRLKPGETRALTFTVTGTARVRVSHVRVNARNARYMAETELHKEVRALLKEAGLDPDQTQRALRDFSRAQPLAREIYTARH